jgi:beta-glucan synthesis-associated protein KRE6
VFSDEFEQDGRTFHDGRDPRWTAINKNDYTNAALHYYSHDNAHTRDGVLHITTEQKVNAYRAFDEDKKQYYKDYKHVQTGMLQGWNKFCFVGGIVEFSAQLPGDPTIGGLWPALWMLGNLARATYVGSSDFMWPFSYNACNASFRNGQEINACSRLNHYDLHMYRGRGAPEIDVIEAMQGAPGKLPSTTVQRPYQSASLQIAPGVSVDRPSLGKRPDPNNWYTHLEYGNKTKADLNPFFYGVTLFHKPKSYTYQADALSANMPLNKTHYERQHVYRVEWEPASLQDGTGGYIKWFSDNELVYGIVADSLAIMGTEIPTEPMYLLMNTAVSSDWGFPKPCPDGCDCDCYHCASIECRCGQPKNYCNNFPASFDIDYVRVYQAVDDERHILGCSPKDRPTATFIQGHKQRYMDMDGTEAVAGLLPLMNTNHQPLQPIQHGGGICVDDADCGRKGWGTCDSANLCTCAHMATGPHCLSHAGFYDHDTSAHPQPFCCTYYSLSLFFLSCLHACLVVAGDLGILF